MKEKNYSPPPPTRRKFSSAADEQFYLYDKLLYWFYERENPSRSRWFANKMRSFLEKEAHDHENIIDNECLALIHEVEKDWERAEYYRRREIYYIEKLRELAKTEHPIVRKRILSDFTEEDLAGRYNLLSITLWEAGKLEDALIALEKSEQLCIAGGYEFEGMDLRKDIEEDLYDACQ